MPLIKATTAVLGGILVLGAAGCSGGDDGSNEELGQGYTPVPGDSAVLSTIDPAQLRDAEIAPVLAASNTAEIAPSQLAQERAQDAQVLQFAEMMIIDHGMLSDSLSELTQAQGIVPREARGSEILEAQTRAMLEGLDGLSGAVFDSAYAAAMVQSHEATLNAIDSQLLPGASNDVLRRAIEQLVRPTVAAHLQQIRQIQTTLSGQ